MKIKWLGHSCFLITSKAGTKLLTDPFDGKVGYLVPAVEADIVTTSHSHYDHNYIQAVQGSCMHISGIGAYEKDDVRVTGISVYHDEVQGAKRGKNNIYIFDIDDMRICHCGDLGHLLSKEQAAQIGSIDILMIPVGGTYTVDANEALQVVKLIKPKVTIPMHFKTPHLSFPLDKVDKFLAAAGISRHEAMLNKQQLEVSREQLEQLPEIIILDYVSV